MHEPLDLKLGQQYGTITYVTLFQIPHPVLPPYFSIANASCFMFYVVRALSLLCWPIYLFLQFRKEP